VNGSKTFSKHYRSTISAVEIKGLVLRNNCDSGFSTEVLRRNRCECVNSVSSRLLMNQNCIAICVVVCCRVPEARNSEVSALA
jgi:hypothetical protein